MKKIILFVVFLLLFTSLALAATIKGTVYNSNLDAEQNVLVEVNSQPKQQFLAKIGEYQFHLSLGNYTIKATKNNLTVTEELQVAKEGDYLLDLFLLPSFAEEETLFTETQENFFSEDYLSETSWWSYGIAGIIIIILIIRVIRAKKKYGPLPPFRLWRRKTVKKETEPKPEEKSEVLEQVPEPGYLDEAINIIKKHEGRISQKELRKEMIYLSEAKISLILTELEHKGQIEKIKKGRGNVVLLKV